MTQGCHNKVFFIGCRLNAVALPLVVEKSSIKGSSQHLTTEPQVGRQCPLHEPLTNCPSNKPVAINLRVLELAGTHIYYLSPSVL